MFCKNFISVKDFVPPNAEDQFKKVNKRNIRIFHINKENSNKTFYSLMLAAFFSNFNYTDYDLYRNYCVCKPIEKC